MYKRMLAIAAAMWITIFFTPVSAFQRTVDTLPVNTFVELERSFANPGKRYGSAPLWVWHTDITTTLIDTMLQAFKDNGFGGVFVHPRPGLITEYLSDTWFQRWKYTVEKAKQMDMDVWIYDENSYPSGFAGGHVPDQMPESHNQGQMLHLVRTSTLPDDTTGLFIVLEKTGTSFADITSHLMQAKGRTSSYYLFTKNYFRKSPWYGGFTYVDLLVKGVTEKFIAVTMDGYEKTVGSEFGQTVPGIFSDEPNIASEGGGNMRWTPDLFETFIAKWGYDLRNHLPSIFEESGDWKRVRHNYYQVLLQLFIDRWSKPFYAYTNRKKLEWTGHYWEHEWPNPNQGGDNMAMYAWHQRPGIDMLFNQFDDKSPHGQFGNVRSVKELSSVANQLGKKRTLSETYGGGGWELSFKDMKRLGDWEFVLGVNTLNQHLADMTLAGARKYDYPQSFSYHNPWWPYYKPLNRYFARLSLALSSGKQENEILVLEPTTTAWMYASYGTGNALLSETGNRFQQFITRLEKAQVEYDLGSENIIRDHGKTLAGKFLVGERAYSTVVIPPGMKNIDAPTFSLLKTFIQAGGRLIRFDTLSFVDGTSNTMLTIINKTAKNNVSRQYEEAMKITDFSKPAFDLISSDTANHDLYHHRRMLKDGQLIFLSNSSLAKKASGQIRTTGVDVLRLDLFTGEVTAFPKTSQAKMVSLRFSLPPAGSELFFIPASKMSTVFKNYEPLIAGEAVPTQVSRVISPLENSLVIDFCDISMGQQQLKDLHVFDAADTVFKFHGFTSGNPWNTSVQFKSNTVARDTFSRGSGFTATYRFNIAAGTVLRNFSAVIERAEKYVISVNGQVVTPVAGIWWLDKSFSKIAIGDLVHTGDNEITVTASPMSVFAEIEPVYILGDFRLSSAAKGFNIVPTKLLALGSWKNQGMPMFGQSISYVKELRLDGPGTKLAVRLTEWKGTVAAIRVNDSLAGIIAYEPYLVDISRFLKSGNNRVEVQVTGSLKNLLGPHHNSPRPGMVSPGHWRRVKSHPAGDAYETYDYGLMKDFEVIHIK